MIPANDGPAHWHVQKHTARYKPKADTPAKQWVRVMMHRDTFLMTPADAMDLANALVDVAETIPDDRAAQYPSPYPKGQPA